MTEKEKLTFNKLDPDILQIFVPENMFRLEGLQIIKYLIKSEIFKFLSSINEINFIEKYVKNKKPTSKTWN